MIRLGFPIRPAHTGWHCGGAMARDSWDEEDDRSDREERRDARRRRRRRRHRSGRPLSDEERTYREATRRAKARIGFYAHLIAYASVCTLMFATKPTKVI